MLPRFFRWNVARYAQNNAHFTELHQQRRAAVAEKRQRDAGAGDEIRDDRDVQKHLDRQQRRDADTDEKAVAVGRVRGDPIAAADEQRKQDQDRDRADIAKLLADDGKDVVIVLLRQVEVLMLSALYCSFAIALACVGQSTLPFAFVAKHLNHLSFFAKVWLSDMLHRHYFSFDKLISMAAVARSGAGRTPGVISKGESCENLHYLWLNITLKLA